MNISKRDRNLLIGVLALLVGILYYMFLYKSQVTTLEQSRRDLSVAVTNYNNAVSEIKTLPIRKSNIKELTANAVNKAKGFYPQLIQENLIIELKDLMEKNNFKGTVTFSNIEVKNLDNLTPNSVGLNQTTFDPFVASIKSNNTVPTTPNLANKSVVQNNTTKPTDTTCQTLQVTISFSNSTYKQLKDFKLALEGYNRTIAVTNLVTSASQGNSNISGTMTLEFYGLPKVDASDDKYSNWTLTNVYGKDEIFSSGAATGAYSTSVEQTKANESQYDFVAMLKSPSSVQPTVTFGKGNDKYCSTYVYDDRAGITDVVVTLTEVDGKYYYKYTVGDSSYPSSTMGNGQEFTPTGDTIKIDVESQTRQGTDDAAGAKLKVINNTKKSVDVTVNGDDTTKPRLTLISEGSVFKK